MDSELKAELEVYRLHLALEMHLVELEELFKPECKLTLIIRNPNNEEAGLVVSCDSLHEIKRVIERHIDSDEPDETCVWSPESGNPIDETIWKTGCGEVFMFSYGGPE